jgi:anoctamin-10
MHHILTIMSSVFSALNAIVAYLGLYLSAFVYVPFGELIMAWLGTTSLAQDIPRVSAEQAGLGPSTTVGHRAVVKTDRLVGQVFACMCSSSIHVRSALISSYVLADTVTNQAIGAFTELGLPYIKKWIADYRGQKKDRDAGKKTGYEMTPLARRDPQEKSFLQKVERELALVDYSNFTGQSRQ